MINLKLSSNFLSEFSELRLNDFIQRHNHKIPHDYVEFLKKYNGGIPESEYLFKIKRADDESMVHIFYGLIEDKKKYVQDIEWHSNILHENGLDPAYIVIAADLLGNSLLLNKNDHKIYFLYHETDDIYLIANSFSSFVNKLRRIKPKLDRFQEAIDRNDTDFFTQIINRGDKSINDITNNDGLKVIFYACTSNNVFMLDFIVQSGGHTAGCLYLSSVSGAIDCVKYLLAHGCDPNERDESLSKGYNYSKRTCILEAATHGHLEVVKLLFNAGANPKMTDIHGQDALVWAIRTGNDELINYLKDIMSP